MRRLAWLLTASAILRSAAEAQLADDEEDDSDGLFPAEQAEEEEAAVPSAVYIMEHGFLKTGTPAWQPRGTLLLSGAVGQGFEARLSDAKEFVQSRPDFLKMVTDEADADRYYAVRIFNPESPQRVLQASLPAKMLANHFEDWHDILEVSVGASGVPLSLNMRVRHTLGLSLFEHTQVHLSEPIRSEGPRVAKIKREEDGTVKVDNKGADSGPQSFLRKYWWVILIAFMLVSKLGDEPAASGGKAPAKK